jgi:hypothetical protein
LFASKIAINSIYLVWGLGEERMVNLTLGERRGVNPFAAILQPLGIETGVGIVILQISA